MAMEGITLKEGKGASGSSEYLSSVSPALVIVDKCHVFTREKKTLDELEFLDCPLY